MHRQARLDAPGTLHHVMIRAIEGKGIFQDTQDRKDFVTRTRTRIFTWPFLENHVHGFWVESIGLRWGDIEEVRELHLDHRQGNSKKGGGGLKVLFFHYAPQSLTNSPRSHARSARTSFSFLTFWIS